MYPARRKLMAEWEKIRKTKLLVYITGDRPNLETQIHQEVIDHFVKHLDAVGDVKKISLLLYTRGGSTLAAWSIANLIRQFCDEFEVIVPFKAHSAGTLICLGADSILMTKQATLGPIDPSVNGPLNPQIPGAPPNARAPVSVEAIKGFLDFARDEAGLRRGSELQTIFLKLCDYVHPLVLGDVYRTRAQIRMLAKRLLSRQITDQEQIERILAFLCSESGSHDYTINRREAKDQLGLKIEKPDDDLYRRLRAMYEDVAEDLQLGIPWSPESHLAGAEQIEYCLRRGLIESCIGGSHCFMSEGTLFARQAQVGPGIMGTAIEDRRSFEGWKHEPAEG